MPAVGCPFAGHLSLGSTDRLQPLARLQQTDAVRVESEHFIILTNTNLETAVEISKLSEKIYRDFFCLFAGLMNLPKSKGLAGGFEISNTKKYTVK